MSYNGVIIIFYYKTKSGEYKILIANESTYFKESSNLSEQDIDYIKDKEKIPVESEKDIRKVKGEFTQRAKDLENKYKIHIKYDNIVIVKDNEGNEIYNVNFRVENNKLGVIKGNIEQGETPEEAAIRETREEIYLDIRGRPITEIGDVILTYKGGENKSKVFIYEFPEERIVPSLNRQGELFNFKYASLQNLDRFLYKFNSKSREGIKKFRDYIKENNSKPSNSKRWKKVGGTRKNRGTGGRKRSNRRGHLTYKRKHKH
jgi:8-oxo-dGTP pyrophosphatase MutT (NUDIX family)